MRRWAQTSATANGLVVGVGWAVLLCGYTGQQGTWEWIVHLLLKTQLMFSHHGFYRRDWVGDLYGLGHLCGSRSSLHSGAV